MVKRCVGFITLRLNISLNHVALEVLPHRKLTRKVISPDRILTKAGWSYSETFARFHKKTVQTESFADAVL